MRQNTTIARDMTPPILLTECPGGGGHLWARLNPRWYSDSRARPRDVLWCSDHLVERAEHVKQAIGQAHQRSLVDYQKMPVPTTRRCMCQNPLTHPVNAVLPSGKFYRRLSRHGTESLDSQCKACRQAQSRAYRDSLPEEERKRRSRAAGQRHKAKKYRDRKKVKRQRSRRVPSQPLRSWLLDHEGVMDRLDPMDRAALRKMINDPERRHVEVDTVDRIAIDLGQPGLVTLLYAEE